MVKFRGDQAPIWVSSRHSDFLPEYKDIQLMSTVYTKSSTDLNVSVNCCLSLC